MMNLSRLASVGCLLVLAMCGAPRDAAAEETLTLPVRTRVEVQPGSGRYHTLRKELQWDPARTAIVVCDMWDKHWCPTATERVAEMAPRMNEVLKAARARGVLIIHCPSDTMEFYKDTPQYRLAQSAPPVKTPVPLQNWCSLEKSREGNALPIDDSARTSAPGPDKSTRWKSPLATPLPTTPRRTI